jgi:hypothetical protein
MAERCRQSEDRAARLHRNAHERNTLNPESTPRVMRGFLYPFF